MTVVVEAGEGEAGLAGEAGHEDAPCAGDIGESGDAWRDDGSCDSLHDSLVTAYLERAQARTRGRGGAGTAWRSSCPCLSLCCFTGLHNI